MSAAQQTKHTLSFVGIYKSITSLDAIELPGFIVLTGINGSGKSHLLEAIQSGNVSSSLVDDYHSEVKLFTSSTIVPADSGPVDPASLHVNRNRWFGQIQSRQTMCFHELQKIALQLGVPDQLCNSIKTILNLTVDQLDGVFDNFEKASQVHEAIQKSINDLCRNIGMRVQPEIHDQDYRQSVQKIYLSDPRELLKTQDEFHQHPSFLWGDVDIFQKNFGKIFSEYRSLLQKNAIFYEYSKDKYLSRDNFQDKYKTPPWDFVNKLLERSGMDFRINCPDLVSDSPYEPKLTKISKSVGDMLFKDLSSGEKVLMSFALCLYNAQDDRQFKNFPKLLLLDEIDAPLHPSMTKSLIDTIQEVLVEGQKIAVILTTHSPSTVALAPEGSIYAMDSSGPRVSKVTKNKALSILTAGVPTLSIDYSGQRQVFVESQTDARLLDHIYQQFKSYLNPERSLSFIEVGRINKNGIEQNAGCDQVKRFVNDLYSAGNRSVLGLIDWDGRNNPKGCLHVLCHEIRGGIENVLLDPVLVVAAIARTDLDYARSLGLLLHTEVYASTLTWSDVRWQTSIDKLQSIYFNDNHNSDPSQVNIEYQSGMTLKVNKLYLTIDDHDLEDQIKSIFPPLARHCRRRGDLSSYVLNHVLSDTPWLMPKDLLVSLDGLLNFEFSD